MLSTWVGLKEPGERAALQVNGGNCKDTFVLEEGREGGQKEKEEMKDCERVQAAKLILLSRFSAIATEGRRKKRGERAQRVTGARESPKKKKEKKKKKKKKKIKNKQNIGVHN